MMFATPCEEYKGQRRAGARDRPHLHPARRPRAERLDLDGAPVRLVGHQPVRGDRRRRGLPVGPGARRRQRGGAEHAGDIQKQPAASRKIGEFIKQVKDKNSNVRLMGFGHRVYKNYDPRAKLMRETCHEVLEALGLHDDPLFKLAMALREDRAGDDYFVARKLYPNVDFYSGHRAARDRHPGAAVHRRSSRWPHGRLDRPAQRDDRRPRVQDRPSAPALRRLRAPRRQSRWTSADQTCHPAAPAVGSGGQGPAGALSFQRRFSGTFPRANPRVYPKIAALQQTAKNHPLPTTVRIRSAHDTAATAKDLKQWHRHHSGSRAMGSNSVRSGALRVGSSRLDAAAGPGRHRCAGNDAGVAADDADAPRSTPQHGASCTSAACCAATG